MPMITLRFLMMFVLSTTTSTGSGSGSSIENALKGLGIPMEINFHRGQPRPLTCEASIYSESSFYQWFVQGGQTLDDWMIAPGVSWTKVSASENQNDLILLADTNSTVTSVLVYCVRDYEAIGNMTLLVRRENELLYGADHLHSTCNLTHNYKTILSCNGSTWQETGYCFWYYRNHSMAKETKVKEDAQPYIILDPDAPVGEYICKCKIDQQLQKLRVFTVRQGEPRDSFYCVHVREDDTNTSPTSRRNGKGQTAAIATDECVQDTNCARTVNHPAEKSQQESVGQSESEKTCSRGCVTERVVWFLVILVVVLVITVIVLIVVVVKRQKNKSTNVQNSPSSPNYKRSSARASTTSQCQKHEEFQPLPQTDTAATPSTTSHS